MAGPDNLCDALDVPHDWRADEGHRDDPRDVTFTCRFCEARGRTCPACEGLGTVPDDREPRDQPLPGLSLEDECARCNGWGVIESF